MDLQLHYNAYYFSKLMPFFTAIYNFERIWRNIWSKSAGNSIPFKKYLHWSFKIRRIYIRIFQNLVSSSISESSIPNTGRESILLNSAKHCKYMVETLSKSVELVDFRKQWSDTLSIYFIDFKKIFRLF